MEHTGERDQLIEGVTSQNDRKWEHIHRRRRRRLAAVKGQCCRADVTSSGQRSLLLEESIPIGCSTGGGQCPSSSRCKSACLQFSSWSRQVCHVVGGAWQKSDDDWKSWGQNFVLQRPSGGQGGIIKDKATH